MTEESTRVRAAAHWVRYAKLRVEVVRGRDAGQAIDTAGATVRVGTAAGNDLVLSDDSVSRRHCELEPEAGGVRVRDLGSRNGVWLTTPTSSKQLVGGPGVSGGIRVREAVVSGDFELTLGDSCLAVRWLDESVDREQSVETRFGDVIGRSARMRELFASLSRIAATDYTLLVEGETGTGKDLVAESVHDQSGRAEGPFVVLDCGAIAANVIESELFGHEKGAFTGAIDAHAGVFEQAQHGTLFIDEIGELPLDLQPKLLRVLEKRQLRRVGGSRTIAVDVRVIAATNRNLRAEVRAGRFREDLYYRLAAAHVQVPPLRDRKDDLELLVGHFLGLETPPRSPAEVSESVWEMFRAYDWPGNVRELRNAVQRLLISPERPITAMIAPAGSTASAGAAPVAGLTPGAELPPLRIARRQASDAFERAYLAELLASAGGNVTRAAAKAEVSRQMLQKLLKKHGGRDE